MNLGSKTMGWLAPTVRRICLKKGKKRNFSAKALLGVLRNDLVNRDEVGNCCCWEWKRVFGWYMLTGAQCGCFIEKNKILSKCETGEELFLCGWLPLLGFHGALRGGCALLQPGPAVPPLDVRLLRSAGEGGRLHFSASQLCRVSFVMFLRMRLLKKST